MGVPKVLVEDFWGCIQFMECNLLAEILHKLMQFMVSEVAKLCLEMPQGFPTGMGIVSDCMGIPLHL